VDLRSRLKALSCFNGKPPALRGLPSLFREISFVSSRRIHNDSNPRQTDQPTKDIVAIRRNPIHRPSPQNREHYKPSSICRVDSPKLPGLIGWKIPYRNRTTAPRRPHCQLDPFLHHCQTRYPPPISQIPANPKSKTDLTIGIRITSLSNSRRCFPRRPFSLSQRYSSYCVLPRDLLEEGSYYRV
jgi:hypothetical protein